MREQLTAFLLNLAQGTVPVDVIEQHIQAVETSTVGPDAPASTGPNAPAPDQPTEQWAADAARRLMPPVLDYHGLELAEEGLWQQRFFGGFTEESEHQENRRARDAVVQARELAS